MDTIAERIVFLRNQFQMKQIDFAKLINISRSHTAMLERGMRTPSDIVISAICNEFSVNEAWLRTGDGEPFFNANKAMEKAFASYFIEITQAFSPVFTAYGEMMPLFENEDVMRMYNYLALRVKRGGYGKRNMNALISSFDASFPGYEDAIKSLENAAAITRINMESSPIARRLLPVHGVAAAGSPLYDDSTNGDSVEVPVKYCSDRFFVVRVKGESMSPNINDGDHVVVARKTDPENGSLALVYISNGSDDEYVIKLFHRTNKHVELQSYNPEYEPILLPISKIASAEKIVHIIHA